MDHCEQFSKKKEEFVEDRCWEPQYKNDSHKWILNYGNEEDSRGGSTMRTSYSIPKAESPVMGRRTKIIYEKFLKEAENEVLNEHNQPPQVEDYITTYDDNYCSKFPGFIAPGDERKPEPELYDKYPLYSSQPMTYWQFNYEKNFGNRITTPGLTKVVDIRQPFKKNFNFTRGENEWADKS